MNAPAKMYRGKQQFLSDAAKSVYFWEKWLHDDDVEYIRIDIHQALVDAATEEIRRLRAENAQLDEALYRVEEYAHRIRILQDEIAMLRELPAKMLEESARMLSLQGPPPIHITVSQLPEWIKEVK